MPNWKDSGVSDDTTGKRKPLVDGRSLIRQVIGGRATAALADQAVFNAGNFLRGVILARMVTQGEFGLFTLGWTVIVFLQTVQATLVSGPYTVYCPRMKGAALAKFTGSTIIHHLFLTVLLAVIGVCTSLSLTLIGNSKEISVLGWAISIAIVPILLRDYIRRLCFARLWMSAAIAVDLSTVVIQLGLLFAVGTIAGLSAAIAFVIIGSGCLIVTVSWIVKYRREIKVAWPQVSADWKRNWLLGRWALASAVLWVSATSLYPWMLAALHGAGAAGVWAACLGVVALCNPLLVGIQNFVLPKASHVFADGGVGALRSFVPRAALLIGGSATALCVVLMPIGGWLVATLYGDSYSGNGLVVTLLLANFSILSFDFCFGRGLFILERADIDFKINIIPIIIVFLIGIWMVREFGVTGAASSILFGHFVVLILRIVSFFRVSEQELCNPE